MKNVYYVLDGREIREAGREEWGSFFNDADRRRIGFDKVGDKEVSTVFLGIDHRFGGEGPPILFETMVFHRGGSAEEYMRRYTTYDDAEAGHQLVIRKLRDGEAL